MNRIKFKTITVLCLLTLSGCDSIPFLDTTPDYKSAGRSRPLEVPPDLTSVSSNDTYSVPGGATTYSTYSQGQGGGALEQEQILPNPDNVHLERAGSQRWLVVDAPPEKIWPVIREFWTELGFAVRVENPQTGVMETEWVDPSSLTQDEKGNYLDKFQGWLDKLDNLKTRQKFRTRIDRGSEEGTTEIFLSHRSISDTPDDGIVRVRTTAGMIDNGYALKKSGPRTKDEEAAAKAEEIDAELLRRLMVRLGVEDSKSRSVLAAVNSEMRAKISKDPDGTLNLAVNDQFDRAWRRVGLALDRIGFVVEDKDRSNGLFYVRYSDVGIDDAPQKKKGLLDSLVFCGDDDPKEVQPEPKKPAKDDSGLVDKLKFWKAGDAAVNPEKQYPVKVEGNDNGSSQITVTDKDGKRDRSSTANRILSLLYEQLK
ncbi:MAG TPA: outer membrane protein assembly factor BamC [Methylophilaceae bacterium]|nr:outer membrane protein assembly factor BamC [Methylophilaceae bacterium]